LRLLLCTFPDTSTQVNCTAVSACKQ
jgi:hypothetical protein